MENEIDSNVTQSRFANSKPSIDLSTDSLSLMVYDLRPICNSVDM